MKVTHFSLSIWDLFPAPKLYAPKSFSKSALAQLLWNQPLGVLKCLQWMPQLVLTQTWMHLQESFSCKPGRFAMPFSKCIEASRLDQVLQNSGCFGMLRHSYRGEVFEYSLRHFILPDLKLLSCWPTRCRKEAIRGVTSRSSERNVHKEY